MTERAKCGLDDVACVLKTPQITTQHPGLLSRVDRVSSEGLSNKDGFGFRSWVLPTEIGSVKMQSRAEWNCDDTDVSNTTSDRRLHVDLVFVCEIDLCVSANIQ